MRTRVYEKPVECFALGLLSNHLKMRGDTVNLNGIHSFRRKINSSQHGQSYLHQNPLRGMRRSRIWGGRVVPRRTTLSGGEVTCSEGKRLEWPFLKSLSKEMAGWERRLPAAPHHALPGIHNTTLSMRSEPKNTIRPVCAVVAWR